MDCAANGRMTAPLVVFGELCRQALKSDISMETKITRLGELSAEEEIPEADILSSLESAASKGDSLGGIIRTVIKGAPAGLGEPFFEGFEAKLSSMLFSVPALISLSFGDADIACRGTGSHVNDEIHSDCGEIHTRTNHCGGLNGGMTNGEDIVFSCGFKPTPSVAAPLNTVNLKGEEILYQNNGRNDPCVMLRAIPVVEACAWYCLYYFTGKMLSETKNERAK